MTATPDRLVVALLGDSTVAADYLPEHLRPQALLASRLEALLPGTSVTVANLGKSGEFAAGLMLSGRYDREVLPAILHGQRLDALVVRYGQNDRRLMTSQAFGTCLAGLFGQLAEDFPDATLVAETGLWFDPVVFGGYQTEIEPYWREVRRLAAAHCLPLSDVAEAMRHALGSGQRDLYARKDYSWNASRDWQRHLPGNADWFVNKHPNLAGLEVAADVEAKVLEPILRQRIAAGQASAATGKAPEYRETRPDWAEPPEKRTLLDWTPAQPKQTPPRIPIPKGPGGYTAGLLVEASLLAPPSRTQAISALRLTDAGRRLWAPPMTVYPADSGYAATALVTPSRADHVKRVIAPAGRQRAAVQDPTDQLVLSVRLPPSLLAAVRVTLLSWGS